MAAQPSSQQPPEQTGLQHPVLDGVVAAALAAGGATVAGLAPAAAGAAAPATAALTAAVVAKLAADTVEAARKFLRARIAARAPELKTFLAQQFPERSPSAIDDAVSGEIAKERMFLKKMIARLERDIPKALQLTDPDERREQMRKVLEREQRYLSMREEAMNDRAIAYLERMSVKELSPKGAYWKLSPLVKEHTPDAVGPDVVVGGPSVEGAARRWFDGELVEIEVESGARLTVSPNHPVLTDEGWRTAGSLDEADYLVRADFVARPGDDVDDIPATAEEIFRALSEVREFPRVVVPVTPEDFHGDGDYGYVDVVRADCSLRDWLKSEVGQLADESRFAKRGEASGALVRKSGAAAGRQAVAPVFTDPAHHYSGLDQSTRERSAIGSETFADSERRLATLVRGHDLRTCGLDSDSADLDAAQAEMVHDRLWRDTVLDRELLDGRAGPITRDKIVHVQRLRYAGHVYDFQTEDRWYTANSLIVSNCILMGEKFWPWSVLDSINPPTHGGCRCSLLTLDEAVELDYMDPEHANVVDWDALRRAKELLKEAALFMRVATLEEFRAWLGELEEAASVKGAMVAFYPSARTRRGIAAHPAADEPADEVHLTLAFLGPDASELEPQREKIRRAVAKTAAAGVPLKGKVGGIGAFAGDGDGTHPLVALADVPGLNEFRAALVKNLKGEGVMPAENHGFTPHLTMRYVPKGEALPEAKPPDEMPLDFGEVHLVWADKHETWPLGAKLQEAFDPLQRRDWHGRWSRSATVADRAAAETHVSGLRQRWAELDRELLPFAGRPRAADARRIIAEQKEITKLIHHSNVDAGGPEGIGKPGGPRDVVVVGGGPAGLSAAVYGATEGLDTLLVDANDEPGGQAQMSSRIENVLGFPAGVTGRQYARMGLEQAQRTGADTEFGVRVERLRYDPKTGMKRLKLSDGRTLEARAVVIAGGVQFAKVQIPGAEDSAQVVYGDSAELKRRAHGRDVVIVGGANSAGQAAVDAATSAAHVTVLIRRGKIRDKMSSYLVDQLESDPKVTILEGAEIASASKKRGRLESVTLKDGRELPAGAVGVFIGSAPQTDWAGVDRDEHGYIQVGRGGPLETSIPGVYAAGDVRAGSVHRVITAAADGAAAIASSHEFLGALGKQLNETAEYSQRADHIPNDAADDWLDAMDQLDREIPFTGADLPEPKATSHEDKALAEAYVPRRYPRGTREGGEFMPRLGAHPHPLSKVKRALFHQLLPELPRSPKRRRHITRDVEIAGRSVRVPEQRQFERTFGGHVYTSPVGSTHLYRDGQPFAGHVATGARAPMPVRPRVLGRLQQPADDLNAEQREQAMLQVRNALAQSSSELPPASVDAPGWETDEAIREGGFIETGFEDTPLGLQFSYVAPDASSTLKIAYAKDGSRVAAVEWLPRSPTPVGPQLDRPPRTWGEFVADAQNYARKLAVDNGRHALIGEVTVDPSFEDHSAETHWDGSVAVAPLVRDDILAAAAARARTGKLDDGQKRNVWSATETIIHEALHTANPIGRDGFSDVAAVLEEGLTEELARVETVKHLRRQGQDDVAQWQADTPVDPQVLGTYPSYRHALDSILNDAGIAPELREDTITRLKLQTRPSDRIWLLAEWVAAHQKISHPVAQQRVLEKLERLGVPSRTPPSDFDAVPILIPNVDPSPADPRRHMLAGAPLEVGDMVSVNRWKDGKRGKRTAPGKVAAIRDVDGGWLVDIDYGHGDRDYSVLPRQIAAVDHGDRKVRLVFGAAADDAVVNGKTVRTGDTVRYDGRADGGYSEARVVRIVRAENPLSGDATVGSWVLEAVTNANSLRPGTRVLLTPMRVGGTIEPVAAETELPAKGETPTGLRSFTLDARAALAKHFELGPGTIQVPISHVVTRTHPRPSRLAEEGARLHDPDGFRKLAPAATRLPDGRVEVSGPDVATVHAAERVGLTHLPVRVADRRHRVIEQLEADLEAWRRHPGADSDPLYRGRLEGARTAIAIVRAGGSQDEIVRAAAEHGPAHGGGDANEGFQTAMRNAWLTVDGARRAEPAVYLHRPPVNRDVAAELKGDGPLPMQNGLYYRLHKVGAPFGPEHASTVPPIPEDVVRASGSEALKSAATPKPGYSAFWNPHHLVQYVDAMGWEPKDVRVVAFRGTPIGEGSDGEPRVMPDMGRVLARIGWQRFLDRVEVTPNGYGRWDEHTWGDGPDGRITDDGYRTLGQMRASDRWDEALRRARTGGVPSGLRQFDWQKFVYGGGPPADNAKELTQSKPVKVDAKKLRGGEIIEVAGKTWKVHLTGTNKVPTLTLRDQDGHEEVYPEAELPKATLVKGAYGQGWQAPAFVPRWNDEHTLKLVKPAGGSNDATFAEAEGGQRWMVKRYRGDVDRVATELLANAIYRRLGVAVPEAGTTEFDGKPALAYPLVEGEQRHWSVPNAELGRGFMADALLANWDVIGLTQDNVLWDADGKPVRLDQGGTLQYRAQGQRKPFGPVPSEVWSMASPAGGQAFGTMDLTPEAKRAGASRIVRELKPEVIDELVAAAPFADEKMRGEVRDALKARVAWMGDYAAGKALEPQPIDDPDMAAAALREGQAGLELYPEQDVAVRAFAEGWDQEVNAHLRAGKASASKELRFLMRELDTITKHAEVAEDVWAYAVVKPDERDVAGATLTDKGFMPLMLDPVQAAGEAGETAAVLRVLVPKGTHGLYLRGIPGVELDENTPSADLVLGRNTRVRILRASADGTELEGAVVR